MVHNGIEYGMMQAYAEGLDLLRHKTEFNLDSAANRADLAIRQRDSLLAARSDRRRARKEIRNSMALRGYVTDSGEGRWTAIEGIELGVPLPVISSALDAAIPSRKIRIRFAINSWP